MRVCMQVGDTIEREVVGVPRALHHGDPDRLPHGGTRDRGVVSPLGGAVGHPYPARFAPLPRPIDLLYGWITEQVRRLVEVVVRIVRTVIETVCELIASIVLLIVRVVTTVVVTIVRFVCFWVSFILNWIRIIVAAIVGIPEFVTCLLGLRVRKHLGICVTVLADAETSIAVVDDATVTHTVQGAARITLDGTKVRLREHDRRIVPVGEG